MKTSFKSKILWFVLYLLLAITSGGISVVFFTVALALHIAWCIEEIMFEFEQAELMRERGVVAHDLVWNHPLDLEC